MNYSNSNNVFANRILEIDTSRNNVSNIMNPKIKYVKVDKEATRQAEDKTAAADERDKRSMASPTPAPAATKPQSVSIAPSACEESAFRLDLTNQGLYNGFIMSEALGRPKCFRSNRRPNGK